MQPITIVGGGLAGLVAAIELADRGGRVVLHEARGRLGGRAESRAGEFRTNLGPHALYRHGAAEAWLRAQELLPRVVYPSVTGLRLHHRGRLRRLVPELLPALRLVRREPPIDRDFRSWATEQVGEKAAEAAIGVASLPTFHPDPGQLSAAFVHERLRRTAIWRPVYYIVGGWGRLVEALERRARERGVGIETGSRLAELPDGPCIVATPLPQAARLLGESELAWPGAAGALLDLALERRSSDPTAVLSLDERLYVSDYASVDEEVAPAGRALLQCAVGLREGEGHESALARLEGVLDRAYRGWRDRVLFRHQAVAAPGWVGASDPPGSSWRDRPAISRGGDRWLVGDSTAAPGLLSEVSFASAQEAARQVAEKFLR